MLDKVDELTKSVTDYISGILHYVMRCFPTLVHLK